MYEIKDIDSVVKNLLNDNEYVENYHATPLLAPGENFGSLVLSVKIFITNRKTSESRTVEAIAKVLSRNLHLREIFNIQETVKREIEFYTNVFKELDSFAKNYKFPEDLHFLCKFYGARLSLDENSTIVDEDSILLLENLKKSGYEMGDRLTGFDLETTKTIFDALALLHALPIAYRIKNPKDFEEKLKPLLCYQPKKPPPPPDDQLPNIMHRFVEIAELGNPKCKEFSSRLKDRLNTDFFKINTSSDNNPFNSIVHLDFWVNNVMVKYAEGKPYKAKILDFQIYKYGSLVNDVFFFLFTSVMPSVVEKHLDELVKYYHDKFIQVLKHFDCEINSFSLDKFYEEFKKVAETETGHVLFMLNPICLEKGKIDNMDDLEPSKFFDLKDVSDLLKERVSQFVLLLARNNWI